VAAAPVPGPITFGHLPHGGHLLPFGRLLAQSPRFDEALNPLLTGDSDCGLPPLFSGTLVPVLPRDPQV